MQFSARDYTWIANLLLVPVQFLLIRAVPGMGLDGSLGREQQLLFIFLVWGGLILEFPAMAVHTRLARSYDQTSGTSGFSRITWALLVCRVVLLLALGVLALDLMGLPPESPLPQFFIPIYGIIYILFAYTLSRTGSAGRPVPMRHFAIGAFAAFWNLALLTSLWNIIEAELMHAQPLPQASMLVMGLLALLAVLLYIPARLPYLLVERARLDSGLRRTIWIVVLLANIVVPIVAAYTR